MGQGRSYGIHLHFELHEGSYAKGQPNAVDPMKYISLNVDVDNMINKTVTSNSSTNTPKQLSIGAKVMVKNGAKDYNGKSLAQQVYKTLYNVISVSNDRVVIGIGKVVTAAVRKDDLNVR